MGKRTQAILATAFEDVGGQWVYYPRAWSGGVPVSAEERELFLRYRMWLFKRAVGGRPKSEPPRPYWPALRRMVVAMVLGRET